MKQMSFLIILLLIHLCGDLSAEVVTIVHVDNIDSHISANELRNIYRNRKRLWSDGSEISLCTLSDGETHRLFMTQRISNTTSQFRAFWRKQVFTGKGRMPRKHADDKSMILAVAGKKGAIGYIDRKHLEAATGIKELVIIE